MSRVRNGTDFLQRLQRLGDDYEGTYGPLISRLRRRLAPDSPGVAVACLDEGLEAHARAYFVNAFLAALNWRLDVSREEGLPNLVPEAPVRSVERKTIRFFDYLGLERKEGRPLLLVETKRSSLAPPSLKRRRELEETQRPNLGPPTRGRPRDASVPFEVSRGLAGETLAGEWQEILLTLRDYVRSMARHGGEPRRVVVTNADWLLLFLDPADAFLEHGAGREANILFYADRPQMEDRAPDLWRELEHQRVLGEAPSLTTAELPFAIAPGDVDRVMHGLRLSYSSRQGVHVPIPTMDVAPVVRIRSRFGSWLCVESCSVQYELPGEPAARDASDTPAAHLKKVKAHLKKVEAAARELLAAGNRTLHSSHTPRPLSAHYEDVDAFEEVRGVESAGRDQFLLTTGANTHFILLGSPAPRCPHHDWLKCEKAGVAVPCPTTRTRVNPRSYFTSGGAQHCAHREVFDAKASPITAENRGRCGQRSGEEGQPFCEIWGFETHLCCRACTFYEVCCKATVFRLPCGDGQSADAGEFK